MAAWYGYSMPNHGKIKKIRASFECSEGRHFLLLLYFADRGQRKVVCAAQSSGHIARLPDL